MQCSFFFFSKSFKIRDCAKFKVIPQKKKLPQLFLKFLFKYSLPLSVSRSTRSACLFKRYDRKNIPDLCMQALFIPGISSVHGTFRGG